MVRDDFGAEMKECLKCGALTEDEAKLCPSCGSAAVVAQGEKVKPSAMRPVDDTKKEKITFTKLIGLFFLGMTAMAVDHFTTPKKVETKISDSCPSQAIMCNSNKYRSDAARQCKYMLLEQLNRGGSFDGGLPEFDRSWWVGKNYDTIAYKGSNLLANNMFGGQVRAPFVCELNIFTRTVDVAKVLTL